MGGKEWRQETTGYDIAYRPTGTKVTVPSGEGALSTTYSSSVTYDPITGLPYSTDVPAVGGLPKETLYTGRNVNGLPVSMGSSTVDYVNWTTYDEFGTVQRTTLGDVPKQVSFTNVHDPATGRLLRTQLDKEDSTTPVDITDYTFTPAGDVTSVTTAQGAAHDTQCFAYDYLRRLTRAWTDTGTITTKPGPSVPGIGNCANTEPQPGKIGGPAPYNQSFTYDVTGNRTSSTDHDPAGDAAKATTTTNTFPAPGTTRPHAPTSTTRKTGTSAGVTSAITYDATGNTLTRPDAVGATQTLTWTPEGKLASATSAAGTSTYVYDAAGNRLLRKDPGKTTLYLGSTELTLNTATNTVTGTRYYPTPGGPTIVRTSDGKLSYTAADHHNTGTTAIDATLQVQRRATKPFGEDRGPAPADWPGERGFVNGTKDKATGFTYLGAREYDPRTGAFLSVDPIMVLDSAQGLNAYSYAKNSPVTTSDPTGLCAEVDCPTRPSPDHENTTPGHEPGPPKRTQTSQHPRPTGVLGNNYNCSLSRYGCGGPKPPAPPAPLPSPSWLPPLPPVVVPSDCRPDDGRLECMTDVAPSQILEDPFNIENSKNGSNKIAYTYASGSDSCTKRAQQYLCFGAWPNWGQPITIGDVHFYHKSKEAFVARLSGEAEWRAKIATKMGAGFAEEFGPDIERHEAVHSQQWARSGHSAGFALRYFSQVAGSEYRVGTSSHANRFEQEANLWWGGYLTWYPSQILAPGEHPKF